jgi:hypothetical protein
MHSQAYMPSNHLLHNCRVSSSHIFLSTPTAPTLSSIWPCLWYYSRVSSINDVCFNVENLDYRPSGSFPCHIPEWEQKRASKSYQ